MTAPFFRPVGRTLTPHRRQTLIKRAFRGFPPQKGFRMTTYAASASAPSGYQSTLARVVQDVIAPAAEEVDRSGTFPRRQIEVLAESGLLALTVPEDCGGGGQGLPAAAEVVQSIGAACGSTAMVVTMHYSATAALLAAARTDVLREIGAGRHLSTLAFSEYGSRSHFWAPVSTATAAGQDVLLDARKSWVTAAGEADSYVWSSRPLAGPTVR